MQLPTTLPEFHRLIAIETARMSYPGSMSRGKTPVVVKHTKKTLEKYFSQRFPLKTVWDRAFELATTYQTWHRAQVSDIAVVLKDYVSRPNDPEAVASKFLNTFMHQLMKYQPCRPLLPALHLPLDRRVFKELSTVDSKALAPVKGYFRSTPYRLPYETHLKIQEALLAFLGELNQRAGAEYQLTSRIELNWLWIGDDDAEEAPSP